MTLLFNPSISNNEGGQSKEEKEGPCREKQKLMPACHVAGRLLNAVLHCSHISNTRARVLANAQGSGLTLKLTALGRESALRPGRWVQILTISHSHWLCNLEVI